MGTVNQQSVREEAERIKTEFNRLAGNKKVNNETKMLFQSMFMLINLLIAIFLEKTTKKNNKNSNKPSSQTEKDNSSLASKGKAESDTTIANTRTVETIEVAPVLECDVCGEDLTKTRCKHFERRTKIDIVFEKVLEHVDAEIKQCPSCNAVVKGVFPSELSGPLQYGNGLKAYIINWTDDIR